MDIIVTIKLFDSFAVYHIFNEHEGVFIARLKSKSMFITFTLPELIFLHKGEDWVSDCLNPEVVLLLTNQIDIELKKSEGGGKFMQKLEEKVLMAQWKSYMTFKHSGDARRHNLFNYKEINFTNDRTLTIKEYNNDKSKTILSTNEWSLTFSNKKHYLNIPTDKITFEIITVNHVVMVLLETATGEKIFYAKENSWKKYIEFNKERTM